MTNSSHKLTFYREKWPFFWMPPFAYCILVFALSAQDKAISVPGIPSADKLLHVIEYSMLGFLMVRAFFSLRRPSSRVVLFIISLGITVLFAFSDELHQFFVPGRTASLADVMADGLGALAGTLAYWKIIRSRYGARGTKSIFLPISSQGRFG